MATATWQQANGAKKCEDGRPKTVRNRHPKKCESEKVQKRSKTSENSRNRAKTITVSLVDRFSLYRRRGEAKGDRQNGNQKREKGYRKVTENEKKVTEK